MTDKELLELAGKAVGLELDFFGNDAGINLGEGVGWECWDPLTDDGDALRLAVRLEMLLDLSQKATENGFAQYDLVANQVCNSAADPCAATRRAIVLAAAEIGRTKP